MLVSNIAFDGVSLPTPFSAHLILFIFLLLPHLADAASTSLTNKRTSLRHFDTQGASNYSLTFHTPYLTKSRQVFSAFLERNPILEMKGLTVL